MFENSYKFLIILKIFTSVYGISIENYYTKGCMTSLEDKQIDKNFLKDFDQMKKDIEELKQEPDKVPIRDQPIFDIRFDKLPEKCQYSELPSNCDEATKCTKLSGYYHIAIESFSSKPFLVECEAQHKGGGWVVIQRRQDGSEDFYRSWSEYQQGFGDMSGEFFIGLDKLHAMTNCNGPQELMILMENNTNYAEGYATYDAFQIGNETEKYILKRVGRYTGTAGDSLRDHIGMKFTTKDQDNDDHPPYNCAEAYTGGWWYHHCHSSNLNGRYGDNTYGKGNMWYSFSTHENSLKFVKMMIRRRRN